MTSAQFYAAARALWGDHWLREASDAFKANERTVRAWAHDRDEIPPGVVEEIRAIALEKITRLMETTGARPAVRP